ncbi:MAG TPA: dihydrodipicolinate synthase family protein [Mesotoga sp.]|mgnify:FL=1|nr:dihydrodipicolinate synthase family protein [Mesotoga sp.]MDD4041446.1 dihydrodipicolinate synthase family protein [Mesotoga sp.]HPI16264.1 dihydrodipicolinate synthase family protein [Mesotoga sp.]HQC56720.1 dihydrodipicolinate synthase family protein [Mesotoga sp.]HQQ57269.1 dihydrodipicolinate synthase family protein [Mesotoga sp.]
MRLLEGVGVAPLTPMSADGTKIEYGAISNYVDFLVEKGVNGMFVLGTTGEGTSLCVSERKKALEAFIKANDDRMTIISHCGAAVFEDILDLLKHSRACGAHAAAVVTPFFFKHSQDELFAFYDAIATEMGEYPLYIYNIPSLTKNWISVDVLKRLHQKHPWIVGVKDSSGDFVYALSVIQNLPGTFNTVVGCDAAYSAVLTNGGKACVSGPGAVFPEFFVKVRDAVRAGKYEEAFKAQKSLTKLTMAVGNGANIPYMKAVLEKRGLKMGGVRMPLKVSTREEMEDLDRDLFRVMAEVGIQF